jgi:hypothetical protein
VEGCGLRVACLGGAKLIQKIVFELGRKNDFLKNHEMPVDIGCSE